MDRPATQRSEPRSARGIVLAALALTAGLGLGCGDGTGPGASPRSLEIRSAVEDSAGIGDTLRRSLRVAVESSGGDPVSGVEVRFRVTNGAPGRVEPRRATTDRDGVARTRFIAGDRVGTATVRADLPAYPDVSAVQFTMRTVIPTRTRISLVSGDGQRGEVGSQLPRPLVVRVTTPDGVPAAGVPVAWGLASAPGAGTRLTADTVYAGGDGRARALLTLGDAAGEVRVTARSRGSDSAVAFSATALDSVGDGLRLDSLRPRSLRAGDTVTLFGAGFSGVEGERVWVGGEEAEVRSSGGGRIRARVPSFAGRCLPARTVGVRVVAGDRQSNGLVAPLRPSEPPVDLEVGESLVVGTGGRFRCLRFAADSAPRLYRIGVQVASRASAVTPARLVGRSGSDVGAGEPSLRVAAGRFGRVDPGGRLPGTRHGPSAAELDIRTEARKALDRAGARPAEAGASRTDRRTGFSVRTAAAVRSGDRREFLLSVSPDDLAIDCRDTTAVVTAVARAVGENVVLYEDTASPARGFSDDDYRLLRDEFEDVVFPVDTAYFGRPLDIDGNGRIVVLFTPEVNEMNPPGSETFLGGFFLPTDLAESGDASAGGTSAGGVCPVSNEAEVIYLPVPDPLGGAGQPVSRERALRNARSVTAHELQHLISAQRRVFRTPVADGENPFDDLETAWLSEGLAHLAEEVTGLALAGLRERSRLGFDEAVADLRAFNAFHLDNFARARIYMRNPNRSPALSADDPGGIPSLEMRGFGWLFARFLGDQVGPAGDGSPLGGSSEHRLFRELSRGGAERHTGVENVLRAARRLGAGGTTWEGLLGDFGVALAAGRDSVVLDPDRRIRTWNLGELYAGLHRNLPGDFREGYPLRSFAADYRSTAVTFDLNRSTTAYVRLRAGGAHPSYALRIESPDGSPLSSSVRPQVLLLRAE